MCITKNSQYSQNIAVILAINKEGIVHSEVKRGYYKSDDYVKFLKSMREILPKSTKYSLYQDGARFHTTKDVTSYLWGTKIKRLQAIAHSPQHNAVEYLNSMLKRQYRQRMLREQAEAYQRKSEARPMIASNRDHRICRLEAKHGDYMERSIKRKTRLRDTYYF